MLWKGVIKVSLFFFFFFYLRDAELGVDKKLWSGKHFKTLENVYTRLALHMSFMFLNHLEEISSETWTMNINVVYESQNLKMKTHLKHKTRYQKINE